jgi:hypothetical protein
MFLEASSGRWSALAGAKTERGGCDRVRGIERVDPSVSIAITAELPHEVPTLATYTELHRPDTARAVDTRRRRMAAMVRLLATYRGEKAPVDTHLCAVVDV